MEILVLIITFSVIFSLIIFLAGVIVSDRKEAKRDKEYKKKRKEYQKIRKKENKKKFNKKLKKLK
jgi:uncharacterized membrane protein (DUF106 family)